MFLRELHLVNFRNYSELSIRPVPGVNCFTGPNGSGKTNILDAIHYLSLCKSFSNPIDSQNIRFGEDFFVLEGMFEVGGMEEKIYCGLKRNQKKQFLRNKSEYEKLADHIGLLPLVLIAPQDDDLLHGGSEERRKFLDSVIAQFNHAYLEDLIAYNRILTQRNALLKSMKGDLGADAGMLDVLDEQLVDSGMRIYATRKKFIEEFQPLLGEAYRMISDGKEVAEAVYQSRIIGSDFLELLRSHRERDVQLQYTGIGVHRDDLELLLDGRSARKFASQGQQKSLLISLRIAQYRFIQKGTGKQPLLLLDDISAKLDDMRLKKLMQMVLDGAFGQIFITDTHPERVRGQFVDDPATLAIFSVTNGSIDIHEHVGA